MKDSTQYDVIVIGTGAGGGTLAWKLAQSGKKVLILERGPFLPREKENWDTKAIFQENRYHTTETWYDKEGKSIHPGTGYWVGGNTKVYGAALFRLRREDFETLKHKGGISPEWPVKYNDFEPYYTAAEKLYCVHGQRGVDPTEPTMSADYPFPSVSNEPRIQEIFDEVKALGYKPFPVPLGLKLNEANRVLSECIRCDTCDGFPCLVDAKSDSDHCAVRPALAAKNVTLVTEAKVLRLITDPTGRTVTEVETQLKDGVTTFSGKIVALCAGAINSAGLLLRSSNVKHPNGLANGSDQVGRNFMFHQAGAILAISPKKNPSRYMKTFAVNDFYFGSKDFPYPMGNVQLVGSFNFEMMRGDAPPLTPGLVLEEMATRAVPWWLTAEDLPDANNRVRIKKDTIELDYTPNNTEAYEQLIAQWTQVLKKSNAVEHVLPLGAYFKKRIPLEGVGHQNGTCRMGRDPKTSVLNEFCRSHEVDNLYVVDGSFFPSSSAVNPSLTIMANALRVGDHINERLK